MMHIFCFYCGKSASGIDSEKMRKTGREIGLKKCKVSNVAGEGYICKMCRVTRKQAGKTVTKIEE